MIEWVYNRLDTGDLPRRLDRLVNSLSDERVIPDVALTGAAAGDLIPHGGAARYIRAQVMGANPAIGVSVGDIDTQYVRLYSTAACVVNLYVRTK